MTWCAALERELLPYAQYPTREDAINAGIREFGDDAPSFHVGRFEPFKPGVDVLTVIGMLRDDAYECCDEASYGWLDDVSADDMDVLEARLNEALTGWLAMTRNTPQFGVIEDVEEIEVPSG